MKKALFLLIGVLSINVLVAQDAKKTKAAKPKKTDSKITVAPKRLTVAHPSDHFLIQVGSDSWTNKPDSIRTSGGRFFNFYLMLDKPFKTNPKFSTAYGLGLGTSNIYFDKTYVNLGANTGTLQFTDQRNGNHFEKFKVTEIFLELPVELRYTLDPENSGKSWKFAVGAKVGTLLKAYSKGKNLVNASGASINDASYIVKEYDTKYFNSTRLTFTGRVGYGNFSINAGYSVTNVIKGGFGPSMNNFTLGLTVSGL